MSDTLRPRQRPPMMMTRGELVASLNYWPLHIRASTGAHYRPTCAMHGGLSYQRPQDGMTLWNDGRLQRLEKRHAPADAADNVAALRDWLAEHRSHAEVWKLTRSGFVPDIALQAFMVGCPTPWRQSQVIPLLMGRLSEAELRAIAAQDAP